jgi:tetratricopeptide (TPR) repeat protein
VAEQFYRRSAWDSAMAYYGRAIEADSTFALAHHHAGLVVAWRRSTGDSLSHAYLLTAARYNRRLPRRDSLLITADSVRASLSDDDPAYTPAVRRLFATLRTARDSFPTDPEIWFALGDAYFHFGNGPRLTVNEDTTLAAFDRSIQLDSGFTPAYIHALEMRLARDGRDVGLRYATAYLALQPIDEEADGIKITGPGFTFEIQSVSGSIQGNSEVRVPFSVSLQLTGKLTADGVTCIANATLNAQLRPGD